MPLLNTHPFRALSFRDDNMTAKINLTTGQKFNRLSVIRELPDRNSSGCVRYLCLCDCGNETIATAKVLRSGEKLSCGCAQRESTQRNIKHLTGMVFGRITVKSFSHIKNGSYWNCLCECGTEKIIRGNSLVLGMTKSCGCMNLDTDKRRIDLTGMRFGELTVIELSKKVTRERSSGPSIKEVAWKCLCDCGNYTEVISRSLVHGMTKSCGHLQKTANGLAGTKSYKCAMQAKREAKKLNNGGSFTVEQINRLYSLQKEKCAICKTQLLGNYHRDHVTPLSAGGSSDISNIQLLCPYCNMHKSNKLPIHFMQSIGFLL